VLNRK